MDARLQDLPFDPAALNRLSTGLITSHYQNNYGGAVKRLNAIRDQLSSTAFATAPGFQLNGLKREELIATNSMLLHEAYFDSLGERGGGEPDGALAEAIARDFGSLARWRSEFVAMGKALGGGSGWVVLTRSPRDGTLANVWAADHSHALAGGTPVLALDMYEHSYHLDYGANAGGYVDAFMANIAWPNVAARFAGLPVAPRPNAVDNATARRLLQDEPGLVVIDARLVDDAAAVPVCLQGARRAPPDRVEAVAASLPKNSKALVYCAWGFDIGGDCAARLREHGIDAVALAGGIGSWRAGGLPTEPIKEGEPT